MILFVNFQFFIGITFQMNGNSWNTKDRSFDMNQCLTNFLCTCLQRDERWWEEGHRDDRWTDSVEHSTGQSQITVKPCMPNTTSITFNVHLQISTFFSFRNRFHLKQIRFRMKSSSRSSMKFTRRWGESVWVAVKANPFPAWYLPPTAKAPIHEPFLIIKY